MSEPPSVQTGVDEIHAHAHKTGHAWLDLVIALSAITISIISLFVAIAHGRTEERLVAASSWPFLTFDTEKDGLESGGWTVLVRLRNGGVGPARVKWLRMSLDGQPIRNREELMRRCCGIPSATPDEQVPLGLVSQNAPSGVLPARETVEILTWRSMPGHQEIVSKLDGVRHRLKAEACYCSVLGECWAGTLSAAAEPRKVAACPIIPDGYE